MGIAALSVVLVLTWLWILLGLLPALRDADQRIRVGCRKHGLDTSYPRGRLGARGKTGSPEDPEGSENLPEPSRRS